MSSIIAETGLNGRTGALLEGLMAPADSPATPKQGTPKGAPRVQSAVRNQVELRASDLDSTLPAEHQDRAGVEIDLVAVSEPTRRIRFGTCKRNPVKLIGSLSGLRAGAQAFLILLCHTFSLVVDWLWRSWTASRSWASATAISQRSVGIESATCR